MDASQVNTPQMLSLLLIEDNPADARLIQILLNEELAGDFRMRNAGTLGQAIEFATESQAARDDLSRADGVNPPFDVAFLDLTLPDSQGLDTLERFQQHCSDLPVVVLSGLDDEALALKALQLGAEDYLVKGRADGNLIKRAALYAIERHRLRRDALLTEAAFQATETGILVFDRNGRISRANPAIVRMSGYAETELIGQPLGFLGAAEDSVDAETEAGAVIYADIIDNLQHEMGWAGEVWNQRHSGDVYPVWVRLNAVLGPRGGLEGYVAIISDITHRKKAEAELRRMATRDVLTGLPNRAFFVNLLEDAVDAILDHGHHYAGISEETGGCGLLFIDLDGFKAVNDTYGHEAGDQVLKTVASRLKSSVRTSDKVARLAGDEFVILLSEVRSQADACMIADKVILEVHKPIPIGEEREEAKAVVSASVGIALCPSDSKTGEGLLRAADEAMYRAKNSGKNRWCTFSGESLAERL